MAAKLFSRPLSREVAVVLIIKVIALTVIFVLFFSPAHRPVVDASARLLGASSLPSPHR